MVDREFLARRGIPYTHAYYEGGPTIFPLAAKFTKESAICPSPCEEIMAEGMELATPVRPRISETGRPGLSEAVQGEGRRLAVVTSSIPEHCHAALRHLDLEKYFDNLTFAQQHGLEKREPDIWRKAAEENGVRPEDCTVFDDSIAACRGARTARMRVVGVYDGFFSSDEPEMRSFCDVYIRSFEELLLPEKKTDIIPVPTGT